MCCVARAATRFPEYVVTMTRNTNQKLTQNVRALRVAINCSSPTMNKIIVHIIRFHSFINLSPQLDIENVNM